ncbi:YueI family protein [Metabacillus arenae]|uniref:YueI family protein n=1 Tax=Metabacillus arenae TaxID=2771434 RepID=A0A926NHG5_9BACI|nr:YueI family protein [Metabacillus arenae]MBD1380865.1 YueI family protein [Metabacillus arenae]
MSGENIDDYLNQGIYGKKRLNPEEQDRFLGTFRERVSIALTMGQVRQKIVIKEVKDKLSTTPNAKLLLNGKVDYGSLSKYVKLANGTQIPFSIVNNLERETDIGLVVASNHAIDVEDIFIN